MKKTIFIALGLLGLAAITFGIYGIIKTFSIYQWYWDMETNHPSAPKITKSLQLMLYDHTWADFITFSFISLVGISLIAYMDVKLKMHQSSLPFRRSVYSIITIILIGVPFYFTFLEPHVSFPDKVTNLYKQRLIDKHNK